jgi:hypothetical protein
MFSPIVIFCYNRSVHLYRLIESIKKNKNYQKHIYYFFVDGPKDKLDRAKIENVLKVIENFVHVKKKIVIREKNLGLSRNIIYGLNYTFKKNLTAIILEDDLEINKYTINFLNSALKVKYKDKVMSISAFSFVNNLDKLKNVPFFLTYRHCSWAWATWSHVWKNISWNLTDFNKYFSSPISVNKFQRGGNDLYYLLKAQMYSLVNSWAVRFNFHCHKNNGLSLNPRYSMVINKGNDGSGTHQRKAFFDKKYLLNTFCPNLKKIKEAEMHDIFNNYIKKNNKKSMRLFLLFFLLRIKKLFN